MVSATDHEDNKVSKAELLLKCAKIWLPKLACTGLLEYLAKVPALDHPPAFKISLRGNPLCALYEVDADLPLFPEKQVMSTPASFNTALAHLLTVDIATSLWGSLECCPRGGWVLVR